MTRKTALYYEEKLHYLDLKSLKKACNLLDSPNNKGEHSDYGT